LLRINTKTIIMITLNIATRSRKNQNTTGFKWNSKRRFK
jgi:hypothetical protein